MGRPASCQQRYRVFMASTTPSGEVSGPLAAVDGVVRRLVRRERLLLLLDVIGRGLLLGSVLLTVVVLAAALRWGRNEAAAALVFLGGAGLWVAVVAPLLGRWSQAGDRLRQARLVEDHAPDLRGRLVTAIETVDRGVAPGQSTAMLGLLAGRAAAVAQPISPGQIHAGWRQGSVLLLGLLLVLVPLPLSLLAGGPAGVLGWWAKGLEAAGTLALVEVGPVGADAQVGDLVLHYTYPAYTGLEPRAIENSTGDAAGPPGTLVEVRAKSAEPIEAAGLVAYEQRYEARVEEGRTMVGTFTIGSEAGTYHLVTWRGKNSQDSRDFAIAPEDDLAPEVTLDASSPILELAVDEHFPIQWRARDDYGIRKVMLRVAGKDIDTLYTSEVRQAEVFDQENVTPADLGLSPGDEVEIVVAAWDNDTVSGQKVGVSQPITLVVLGPRGLSNRTEDQRDQIIEAMLGVLAEHLVEPFPLATKVDALGRWGETVSKRYEPLSHLVDEEWDRLAPESLERRALEDAVTAGGDLVRFAAVTFDRGSLANATMHDIEDLRELRDDAIETLEDGILMLDRAKRNQALAEAVQTTENMEQLAADLEEVLAQKNPDPQQMLAMMEQLADMMRQLAEQTAKLNEGGLKEFLNARSEEMNSLMDEIKKAIQEGRMDDARKMMERLADQMQQLAEGMRDTMDRQQGEGSDAMKQAEQLKDELAALEQEQRDLQKEVEKLRDESDQAQAEEQNKLWEKIRAESTALLLEMSTYRLGLQTHQRDFSEKQRSDSARLDAQRLDSSVRREDVRGSRFSLRNTQFGVDAMFRAFKTARLMKSGKLEGPGKNDIGSLMVHLDSIDRLLDELDQQASPQTAAKSQELQQKQQELQERLESAQQAAGEMMKEFPTNPREMGEQLEKAGERMKDAGEDLGEGKPMQAQGSQGAAADNIKEARESLEQAMEQAQQQSQQGQGGQGKGQEPQGEEQDGKTGKNFSDPPRVELPGAEEFRTPEEYRKALLEGMEGRVPDEFRAMKKRYFEELVRQ